MSGPICPDCGLLALEETGENEMKCPICGWAGESPPRKKIHIDIYKPLYKKTEKLLALRKKGKLFYYRVYLEANTEEEINVLFSIKSLLSDADIETVELNGTTIFMFFRKKNIEKSIRSTLKDLNGVKKITVF